MIDKSAVQEIRDMALAAHEELMPKTDCPAIALPDSFDIKSMEHLMKGRYRFRGQLNTSDARAYGSYCKHRTTHLPNNKPATCMVDSKTMRAVTFFNMGDESAPGHCDDTAILTLEKTPEYEALLEIDGKQMSQQDLVEYLEDWRDIIIAWAGEGATESISVIQAIAAVRSMSTIKRREDGATEGHLSSSRTALEEQELRNAEKFPCVIDVICRPYEDLAERKFSMRIAVHHREGHKPTLTLRMIRKNLVMDEIAKEFAQKVEDWLLDANVEVYIGTFKKD